MPTFWNWLVKQGISKTMYNKNLSESKKRELTDRWYTSIMRY